MSDTNSSTLSVNTEPKDWTLEILSIDDCEIDHIIPYDRGGPTEIENAQLLHRWCNRSKGILAVPVEDFEDYSEVDGEIAQ